MSIGSPRLVRTAEHYEPLAVWQYGRHSAAYARTWASVLPANFVEYANDHYPKLLVQCGIIRA
jgi:hypothetical protein